MQKQKKYRLPLLILTVPVILLYLLFALQPPDDYSDPAPNAIWSETIAGYGTGTPYNMINTSGKVAKRTSERYFYFAKGGERPGIYRKTRLGRAKRITYDDASYLNLYAQEEDSATEWIYYIRDGHTLCRVKVDGTAKEVLSNDCAFIFLRDRTLYFTNTDNELRSVGLSHIDQMDVRSRLIAQAASPKFCYNNFRIYFPYASGPSNEVSLAFFNTRESFQKICFDNIPSSWNINDSRKLFYTDELYFFEGVFVQYDTQEGDIHATFSF